VADNRRKNSAVWRIIGWLGSLQLALVLLATIAIACAIATFAESSFDARVAQAYIYQAPWFIVWLGVLCVNLFAVTLTRWPWKRRHTGFIITHYGIITLLVGAMIGLHAGFEGNVTLRAGEPPVRRITLNRSIIQIASPSEPALYFMPFDAAAVRPTEKRPRTFTVPGTPLRIVADGFSENLVREETLAPSEAGSAAVLLRFSSERLGRSLTMALAANAGRSAEKDFFGLATVRLQDALPSASAPAATETQMVFARFAPVVQAGQAPSGISVSLSSDGEKVTVLSADGTRATFLRAGAMNQPLAAGPATVTIENYWPDFEMRDGRPATKSERPDNPAALVRIHAPAGAAGSKPELLIAQVPGGISYQLKRGGGVYASGQAKTGGTFALGWADWQAEVVESLPKAGIVSTVRPGPPQPDGSASIPGFRAALKPPGGPAGPPRWIMSGETVALTDGHNDVRVSYGLEVKTLPFSLRLRSFDVPRYEGTDTPSNFISDLEFEDPATGEKRNGIARMNHPANFPGTAFASLTGFNYKFSQAGWNPRDPNETTLQVLFDPGWLCKWLGSLAICVGIAIMFYWKPRPSAQ